MGPSIPEEAEYKPPKIMTNLALTFTFETSDRTFCRVSEEKQML
jgi:hypothetical protein